MQIAVTIPDELTAQAQKLGISLEAYVESLIEQARPKSTHQLQPRTAEQIEGFFRRNGGRLREASVVANRQFWAGNLL